MPVHLCLVKNYGGIGLYWGYYMAWGKTRASPAKRARVRDLYAEMFSLFEAGKLAPLTHCSLPLDRFAEALRLVENRGGMRSETRRVGNRWGSTCSSRWSLVH